MPGDFMRRLLAPWAGAAPARAAEPSPPVRPRDPFDIPPVDFRSANGLPRSYSLGFGDVTIPGNARAVTSGDVRVTTSGQIRVTA